MNYFRRVISSQVRLGIVWTVKEWSFTKVRPTQCALRDALPFVHDDPKGAEAIGELLIDLCNGHLLGNTKVGLRKPRSIPVICCNFIMGGLQR